MASPQPVKCSISNFLYYLTQPSTCIHSTHPKKKIFLNTADRSSGVVFSIASGFLRQKTDLVKMKEVAVTSILIHILWCQYSHTSSCGSSQLLCKKFTLWVTSTARLAQVQAPTKTSAACFITDALALPWAHLRCTPVSGASPTAQRGSVAFRPHEAEEPSSTYLYIFYERGRLCKYKLFFCLITHPG